MEKVHKCKIVVTFELTGYNIQRKNYTLDSTDTVRYFRSTVLDDIRKTQGILINQDEIYNYGFSRIDEQGQSVNFLSDHIHVGVLDTSNGKMQAGIVKFTAKSRVEFPNHVNVKDIIKANKQEKRQKFMKALMNEDVHSVTKFLEKGLDPNFIYSKTRETPLFSWASTQPCIQEALLNILLQHGARLDYRSSLGRCIIHKLISTENITAIKLLYYKGASFEEWDSLGIPALFYALDRDVHIRCLECLLELHPPMNITDSSGNNILHYCCKNGLANHLGIVIKHITTSLCQEAYYDYLFALNISGNTPIHLAILQSQKSCLEMLVRNKSCLEVRNSSKDNPLELAIRVGDKAIIEVLTSLNNQFCSKSSNNLQAIKSSNSQNQNTDITYEDSIEHFKKYSRTLSGNKKKYSTLSATTKLSVIGPKYPLACICINNFTASADNELTIATDDVVTVILILLTKVAFGYKDYQNKRAYGWFPSACIGYDNEKKILEFQKTRSTLENLTTVIPTISDNKTCNFIPSIVFVYMESDNKSLGMEIACRKNSLGNSDKSDSQTVKASPFYVRNIALGSPSDKGGLRIGDQIVYILSNEITTLPMKTVSVILKGMCSIKVPDNLPKNTLRQISFIVLRHNDNSLKTEEDVFKTTDMMSDIQSINTAYSSTFTGFTGFTQNSSDENFHNDNNDNNDNNIRHKSSIHRNDEKLKHSVGKSKTFETIASSVSSGVYCKELPKIPDTYYSGIAPSLRNNNPRKVATFTSSSDSLPSPPPELTCDT